MAAAQGRVTAITATLMIRRLTASVLSAVLARSTRPRQRSLRPQWCDGGVGAEPRPGGKACGGGHGSRARTGAVATLAARSRAALSLPLVGSALLWGPSIVVDNGDYMSA